MTGPRAISGRWLWLLAVALMVVEFLVFDRMTSRYHARVYPRWTDQTQYLTEAYTAAQSLQAHGLGSALAATTHKHALQGFLHDSAAVVIFWLAGSPSRSAVLSLNLLVFLAWQAALLAVIPRVSGSRALGWIAFGLVLCVAWPWSVDAGSAVDFRLDHAAMCLMGVAATLALHTGGFRSTRWSLGFGLAVAVTLLARFLTGVYFAGIFAALAVWILCGDSRWLRLRNLGLAALVPLVLAGPVFWVNRAAIHAYYWTGHMASADADARAPVLSAWQSATYLVSNLGQLQLGPWFLWVAATLTAVLGLAALASRPLEKTPVRGDWLFVSLLFFLIPAAVLGLHRQKSFYVLGVIVPGLILLLLWLWQRAWQRIDAANPAVRAAQPLAVVLALVAGLGFFLQRQITPPHSAEFAAGATQVNRVADYLYITSQRAGLASPRLAVDLQVDYFNGRTMSVLCYERQKTWLPFTTTLPVGIIEEPDAFVMDRLAQSDFVLLTDVFPENGYYPFDRQMRRLYPVVKAWCEQHLRRVDTFPIFNRQMSLYQRTALPWDSSLSP